MPDKTRYDDDYTYLVNAPVDIMFKMMADFAVDEHPRKVNLAPGTYRNESGHPHILPTIQNATKTVLERPEYNHEYLGIAGHRNFLDAASLLLLGTSSVQAGRVASVQTVGGTGACHLGASLLQVGNKGGDLPTIFISNPSWENHHGVFRHAGFETTTYPYYNNQTKSLDERGFLECAKTAHTGSVFVLHPCSHNPTGCDPSPEFWIQLAGVFKARGLFAFFDCAYQGFASGDFMIDRYPIELFQAQKVPMMVAQSFSKNAGMYGERLGALHVICRSPDGAKRVSGLLASIVRKEVSNPPRFAADVMSQVMSDPISFQDWMHDVQAMANRIALMRKEFVEQLVLRKTPGDWTHIRGHRGMFSKI